VARRTLLLVVLAALLVASCDSDTPAGGPNAPCTRSSDCEGELACVQGVCTAPDAGTETVQRPGDAGLDGADVD
jgi:hypothetical protein